MFNRKQLPKEIWVACCIGSQGPKSCGNIKVYLSKLDYGSLYTYRRYNNNEIYIGPLSKRKMLKWIKNKPFYNN